MCLKIPLVLYYPLYGRYCMLCYDMLWYDKISWPTYCYIIVFDYPIMIFCPTTQHHHHPPSLSYKHNTNCLFSPLVVKNNDSLYALMVNLSWGSKLQPNWIPKGFLYIMGASYVNYSQWHLIHLFYSSNFHQCTLHFQHFRCRTCCINTDWQIPNPSYQLLTCLIKTNGISPWCILHGRRKWWDFQK